MFTSQTWPRRGQFHNKRSMCLEERVSVAETLMKLEDRYLGGERLELRSLKQVLIGPWGRNQEERMELGYKTAGLAVEICTNQTPLYNASEKQNLDILNSNQKFIGLFFLLSFAFTMQFLVFSLLI